MASEPREEKITFDALKHCLLPSTEAPIAKKIRSVFYLRQMGGSKAIDALATGLKSNSVLLNHEIAYALGQMQDTYAIPVLTALLEDKKENAIVRHEAAEALAAIGDPQSLLLLEKYCNDDAPEVSDTCKIALDMVKWKQTAKNGKPDEVEASPYLSVDPAPPMPKRQYKTTADLRSVLINKTFPLFARYKAMFALRNRGDDEAVKALADGFDDPSAVFRHEIAYVMGQIQNPAAIAALKQVLKNVQEHAMVRHEAAEALGSIADNDTDDVCEPLLNDHLRDKDIIVSQSCEVALDIAEYWQSKQPDAVLEKESSSNVELRDVFHV